MEDRAGFQVEDLLRTELISSPHSLSSILLSSSICCCDHTQMRLVADHASVCSVELSSAPILEKFYYNAERGDPSVASVGLAQIQLDAGSMEEKPWLLASMRFRAFPSWPRKRSQISRQPRGEAD